MIVASSHPGLVLGFSKNRQVQHNLNLDVEGNDLAAHNVVAAVDVDDDVAVDDAEKGQMYAERVAYVD